MRWKKGNPVPKEIRDSIIAQVLFGERMALKYSNTSIAARLGVGERFICKVMAAYRGPRQGPRARLPIYNARGGRLRLTAWARALER